MARLAISIADWLRSRFELEHGIRSMEGLRGFAVALVFLVHYVSLAGTTAPVAGAMHTIGNSGVDLFFVLSGYLIYGSLMRRPQRFGSFMARRVERIYPAFLAVFAVYLALSLAMPAHSKIPDEGAAAYLLANVLLLPGIFPIEPMITVAWSLSYEMFFYLLAPIVVAGARLRERSRPTRVLLLSLLGAAYAGYCLSAGGHPRLLMFVAGMLLHEAIDARRAAPSVGITLAVLALSLGNLLIPSSPTLHVLGMMAGFGLLCWSCFQGGPLAAVFSVTPLRWLGNMSYSYYLLHGLALHAAFVLIGPIDGLRFWLALPVVFAWTVLPCAVLYLLIERRFSLGPHVSPPSIAVRDAA